MLIGYARVSTADQNLDLQRDALSVAGKETVRALLDVHISTLRRALAKGH